MSGRRKQYDTAKLYLQGLIAFGNIFSGVKPVQSHLTKKQRKGRRAFKAQRVARRAQRQTQR